MKTFPMFIRTTGRRIVVVGGGEQAAQKCRLALKTDAAVVLVAREPNAELSGLAASGSITLQPAPATAEALRGAALAFVATGCPGADACFGALARAAGVLVNVVDRPELCDAYTPAIVDRDPVVVAVGTEGTAPVLARQIKTRVEEMLEPRLGDFATLAGRLRDAVATLPSTERRALWRWVFGGAPRALHRAGREDEAVRLVRAAVAAGRSPGAAQRGPRGSVCVVDAGPGGADLITVRGVQRLQEAEIVFYDRRTENLLEFARRDAERVIVEDLQDNRHAQSIGSRLISVARQGKNVVWLANGENARISGNPEQRSALESAGIAWEFIPGVANASDRTEAAAGPMPTRSPDRPTQAASAMVLGAAMAARAERPRPYGPA